MGWALTALMLGFGGRMALAAEANVFVDLTYFLPLLTAWVAYTRGWSGVSLAVGLAPAAAIRASWQITDNMGLWYGLGFDSYLLGVASAVAFTRPRAGSLEGWLRPHWRVALAALLGLISVLSIVFSSVVKLPDLGISLAGASLVAAASAMVRWRASLYALREHLGPGALLLGALGGAALVSDYHSFTPEGHEELTLGVAGLSTGSALCVAAFLAVAWRVFDWRAVVAALGALFVGENLWTPDFVGTFTAPISAALLGAALSPFWCSQGAERPSPQSARGFALALLALQAFLTVGGYADGWSVAGTAFLAGLAFRLRGLLAGPLALVIANGLASLGGEPHAPAFFPAQGAWIGWLAFAFAFFGLLCNRFAPAVRAVEPMAEPAT